MSGAVASLVCAVALRLAVAQNVGPMNVEKLLTERAEMLAAFKDPHRSPYAAIARRDFQGPPLVIGSAEGADVRLEEIRPRHARVTVQGDMFHVEALDEGATVDVAGAAVRDARLGAGATFGLGRYTIRVSHQNFPALLVLDPRSPRLRDGPPPRWFPPDPAFRISARLERDPAPRDEVVLSTRGNARRARRLGRFSFELGGRKHQLTALRLLEHLIDAPLGVGRRRRGAPRVRPRHRLVDPLMVGIEAPELRHEPLPPALSQGERELTSIARSR